MKDSTNTECSECIDLLKECANQLYDNTELIHELRDDNKKLRSIIDAFESEVKIDKNRFVYVGAGYPLSINVGFSFFPKRLKMLGLNTTFNLLIDTETNSLEPLFTVGGGVRF